MDDETRKRRMLECKRDTPIPELCAGCPPWMLLYMKTIRGLTSYDDKPPYGYLVRKLTTALQERYRLTMAEHRYDWDKTHRVLPREDRVPEPDKD